MGDLLCVKCGKDHRDLCAAHISSGERKGQPCQKSRMKGMTTCYTHGGATRQARTSAAIRIVEGKALAVLGRKTDIQPMIDPIRALVDLAAEAMAFKDLIAGHIEELADFRYEAEKGGEQLRAEVALYERAVDRTAKLCHDLAKLDLDARLARLQEAEVELTAKALDGAMVENGIEEEKRKAILRSMARRLGVAS